MQTKIFCLIVLIPVIVLMPSAWSAFVWHPLDAEPPGTEPSVALISFSTASLTAEIEVTIHGFWVNDVVEGALPYKVLRLPSEPATDGTAAEENFGMYQGPGEWGYSNVPVVRVMLGIPTDAAEITVTGIVPGGEEPLGPSPSWRVYPDIGQFATDDGTPEFHADTAHYASTALYPFDPTAPTLSEFRYPVRDWHNLRVATIPICAFFTSPASETAVVYRTMSYTVSFSGTILWPEHLSPVWDRIIGDNLINRPWFPVAGTRQEQLLIYVPNAYASNTALQKFITWKKQQSFAVTVKQVPADVANTAAAISSSIASFNSSHPCNDIYCLLIGDKADIASSTYTVKDAAGAVKGTFDSDYDYFCLGGANDLYADIFYGRIPIDDAADLTNILNKIMAYEKNPPSGGWPGQAMLAAHREWRYNPVTKSNSYAFAYWKDQISGGSYSITTPTFRKRYGHQFATKAQVISDINTWPCGIVNYDGHGGRWPSVWWQWDGAGSNLTTADVTGLINGGYTPVVIAICCWNGDITQSDCIGEEWIESASKGASAHVGFSIPEWIAAGSQFDVGVFKKIFDADIYRLGPAVVGAHNDNVKKYVNEVKQGVWNKNYAEDNAFGCMVFGDPTMMIRTEATKDFDDPVNINVENPLVSSGSQTVIITVEDNDIGVPEATVCVEKAAEVFSVGITNASGHVSFNINPATPGWLYATVSKHNYTVWQGNPLKPSSVEAWRQY